MDTGLFMRLLRLKIILGLICTLGILRMQGQTVDSIPITQNSGQLAFSPDALNAIVYYQARDSQWFDVVGRRVHLYGKAQVKYQDIQLKAGYIIFDWNTNSVHAKSYPDSSGNLAGFPEFNDASSSFTCKELSYQFRTRKGIVTEGRSKEKDLFVIASKAKYIGAEKDSSSHGNDFVYSKNALITTCDDPHPHFGIRSTKQKVIPDKLVVIGPSHLEISNVPTPIWLPFGFFPITPKQKSGIIFPRDYEFGSDLGIGLKNVGYYFALGDKMDLSVIGSVYSRGSWSIEAKPRYQNRYRYSGSLEIGYSDIVTESTSDLSKSHKESWKFRWDHRRDVKANPFNAFNAHVNIDLNKYSSTNYTDVFNTLNNQFGSSVYFSRSIPGKIWSFDMGLNHTQNTSTRAIQIDFPKFNFNIRTIQPFKRKSKIGASSWYENINVNYSANVQATLATYDSILFAKESLDKIRSGVRQTINVDLSTRFLKYFTFTPRLNYIEVWNGQTIHREQSSMAKYRIDSIFNSDKMFLGLDSTLISYGDEVTRLNREFGAFRTYQVSANVTTKIYGNLQLKKGWLKGFRHTITPSFGISFTPDYLNPSLGYFQEYSYRAIPDTIFQRKYSKFENSLFGSPPQSKRALSLNYSFNNILEGKYYSKRDSMDKKFKIVDVFSINGNYNISADSFNFSPLSVQLSKSFFKGFSRLSLDLNYQFYDQDPVTGRPINKLLVKEKNQLFRLTSGSLRSNIDFTTADIIHLFSSSKKQETSGNSLRSFYSLWEKINVNYYAQATLIRNATIDTLFLSAHNLNFAIEIPITKKWNVRINNVGYDFLNKGLTYADFGFTRNLHCWELGLNWHPDQGVYFFHLRVNPGSLEFLDLPYNRNQFNNRAVFPKF